MRIGNLVLAHSVLAAPMAGFSDKPYRVLARDFGAALVFTEMISARGLVMGSSRTWQMLDLADEPAVGVQLFGAEPEEMARAAVMAVERGAALIDLNMGCPMRKVVATGAGAALLRDIPRAAAIVRAVARAVPVPVTVKMRKGWQPGEEVAVDLALAVAEAGAAAVTVHGRFREEFYGGRADWEAIARVKQAVPVPVIGNGDVYRPEDARRMVALTGCDGVMLARGSLGNPWLFGACRAVLSGEPEPPPPGVAERLRVALRHLDLAVAYYGERRGVVKMRKHLVHYLKGLPAAARLRQEVCRLERAEAVRELLAGYACEG
ncbi:MAG: tRNA dihydrouridine synthase DusB [Moorellales bacterium]